MKRIPFERLQGVYYREHPVRRHNGKPDRCFDIAYRTPGGRQGKVVWEKIGWVSEGYTAQAASQVRAERIRAIRHGEELPNKKPIAPTFGEIWSKYEEWAKLNTKAFDREKSRYEKHLKNSLKNLPVSEITPSLLEGIKSDLQKEGKAPATIKHVLTLTRQVLNKGVALGLWNGTNPVKQVKMPKLNNKRERFLTRDEADRLLEDLEKVSQQWRDIALLSLHTGLRAGEIFGMKWGHINFDAGIITLLDNKSGQAQKAFMTGTAKDMLAARRPVDATPDQWVFTARGGRNKGEKIKEVSDTFKRAVERLGFNQGIEDRRQLVCFHTLRHTFASWLALEGTPILTIKELMRHASLAMTERYSHLLPDHKRQAIDRIDQPKVSQPSEPGEPVSSGQAPQSNIE